MPSSHQPEQLVGRTIAIVFNLKPAKLMGIESNGMVLAASVGDGKPILVSFDEPVPPGARVCRQHQDHVALAARRLA